MASENKPADNQHAPVTAPEPAEKPAAAPAPKAPSGAEKRAEHEAGHVVVADHYGWTVLSVNIKPGVPQQMKVDWGEFGEAMKTINWGDAAQREAIKPRVLDYVTVLVAGHLAENVIDPAEPLISKRLEDSPEVFEYPPHGNADRDRVALFLKRIQRNTMDEVLAAEQRAEDILDARNAHLKAVAKHLVDHGTIGVADLSAALGKDAPGGASG